MMAFAEFRAISVPRLSTVGAVIDLKANRLSRFMQPRNLLYHRWLLGRMKQDHPPRRRSAMKKKRRFYAAWKCTSSTTTICGSRF